MPPKVKATGKPSNSANRATKNITIPIIRFPYLVWSACIRRGLNTLLSE
ncbi:Uncharacterised protein [Vibrio cholerae]|nr:Uncharacterised protein [Vibrio cholerae]